MKSSFVFWLLWIYLLTVVARAQNCDEEKCDMRNGYKCEDTRCHKHSFCNPATMKCECPSVGASTIIQLICGTDNNNYSSEVELHRKACMEYSELEIQKYGPCIDESRVQSGLNKVNKPGDKSGVVIPVIITLVVIAAMVIIGWLYYRKRTKSKFTINKRESEKKLML